MNLSRSQIAVLEALSSALGREAHVLSQNLKLLWQQLYNRLHLEVEDGDTRLRRISNGCEME